MGSYYLDIETTGLDPRDSKIITIQYVELERGTGKQIGELKILKEWEMGLENMLFQFSNDVSVFDPYPFSFIPVGYNLDFENNFLKYYSCKYLKKEINISSRPKIDLFGLGVLMNGGEFKGARLDSFTTKFTSGKMIPYWYENKNYNFIEDYIMNETNGFIKWYEKLHIELPILNYKIKKEML